MSQSVTRSPPAILKRDGRLQPFDTRKVESFLKSLTWGLDIGKAVLEEIVTSVDTRLPMDSMTAEAFLVFLAEIVSTFSARHPDFSLLAGRVYATYHHGRVVKQFSAWVMSYEDASPPVFSDTLLAVVRQNSDAIDSAIVHKRDFDFTYRALHTFERSYLIKHDKEVAERLQFLFMRVAVGVHGHSLDDVLDTYELLSTGKMSFASPILWSGGLVNHHFASCYIHEPFGFEARSVAPSLTALSALWASGGGVGLSVGDVPATRGARGGGHPGLLPLLKLYDSLAAYWSKSSRHRSSSAAAYLPIWHADVRNFVLSRTTRAAAGYRFRNIFPALWIPHLFMRRLEEDGMWSLFDPLDVVALTELYGGAFDLAYAEYEKNGVAVSAVRARALWDTIAEAVRETGSPFIMYADNVNGKNNQMNLGLIKSSNLCTEIVQYSSPLETAVCTLASLCLPSYLRPDGTFDFAELHRVAKLAVRALDRVIDLADYPTPGAAASALRTRSVGVGVQGFADVLGYLELPFASHEGRALNRQIFETIYHATLESSCELAEARGPFGAWVGSPAQRGALQVDMWDSETSDRYDFDSLRARIERTGLRNSVLTAQMPTASTAQLFGNSEGVDPCVSNIVQFRVLSGNFNEVSRPLVTALRKRGLWTEELREQLLAAQGSVQGIPGIPDVVKAVFKTAFEIDPIELVNYAADRGPFIDQSQSLTLFIASPTSELLMEIQLHAWRSGLKTGAYYVRSKPASAPQPFGIRRLLLRGDPSTSLHVPALPVDDSVACPCDA